MKFDELDLNDDVLDALRYAIYSDIIVRREAESELSYDDLMNAFG